MTTISFNLLSFRYYIIREYAIIIQNNIIGFYDWRFLQFVKRKSLFRTRKLITSSCVTLSIGILLGSDPAPPYTDYCKMLEKNHAKHIPMYGAGNEHRLTGLHETCSIEEFRYGVSDRGASIRIPVGVVNNNWKGYLEDRRPAANADPYDITKLISEIL